MTENQTRPLFALLLPSGKVLCGLTQDLYPEFNTQGGFLGYGDTFAEAEAEARKRREEAEYRQHQGDTDHD